MATHETMVHVTQFRYSVELFKRNYEELATFLAYFSAPVNALSFSHSEQRWLWQEGIKEITFLLHNFVAAAMSLVDHTRVLYRRLYEPNSQIPDYPVEIHRRFASDPLIQFVINLRQMAQHYRLPTVASNVAFKNQPDGTADVRIHLQLKTSDLKKYGGWNAKAKQYLASAHDMIEISEVIDAYFERVMGFNAWFGEEQRRIHGVGPDVYSYLLTHGPHARLTEINELAEGLSRLEAKPQNELTFADLEAAFSPVLSILDSRRLMLCRHDARLWLRKALDSVSTRFTVPSELVKRAFDLVDGTHASRHPNA